LGILGINGKDVRAGDTVSGKRRIPAPHREFGTNPEFSDALSLLLIFHRFLLDSLMKPCIDAKKNDRTVSIKNRPSLPMGSEGRLDFGLRACLFAGDLFDAGSVADFGDAGDAGEQADDAGEGCGSGGELMEQAGHTSLKVASIYQQSSVKHREQVMQRLDDAIGQQRNPEEPAEATTNLVDELARLGDLHSRGVLDDAEFKAAKARLLS
jgi:hypothetical protein